MSVQQPQVRAMLGLKHRQLVIEAYSVPPGDAEQMERAFDQLITEFDMPYCCGHIRGFGDELMLQIGEEQPYLISIPSDLRSRGQRFESALRTEFSRRFSG
jgi:hypothetical protein